MSTDTGAAAPKMVKLRKRAVMAICKKLVKSGLMSDAENEVIGEKANDEKWSTAELLVKESINTLDSRNRADKLLAMLADAMKLPVDGEKPAKSEEEAGEE